MELLRPFIITAAHSGKDGLLDLEPAVRDTFTRSDLSRDPDRLTRLGRDHQLLPALDFLASLVPHIALRYEVTIRS